MKKHTVKLADKVVDYRTISAANGFGLQPEVIFRSHKAIDNALDMLMKKIALRHKKTANNSRKTQNNARPWGFVIDELQDGQPRKEIVVKLVNVHGMKEKSAGSFVASIGCCLNALNGKSKKKDGIVAQYAKWLNSGKKGKEPTGDKNSISYVNTVYNLINVSE